MSFCQEQNKIDYPNARWIPVYIRERIRHILMYPKHEVTKEHMVFHKHTPEWAKFLTISENLEWS